MVSDLIVAAGGRTLAFQEPPNFRLVHRGVLLQRGRDFRGAVGIDSVRRTVLCFSMHQVYKTVSGVVSWGMEGKSAAQSENSLGGEFRRHWSRYNAVAML